MRLLITISVIVDTPAGYNKAVEVTGVVEKAIRDHGLEVKDEPHTSSASNAISRTFRAVWP